MADPTRRLQDEVNQNVTPQPNMDPRKVQKRPAVAQPPASPVSDMMQRYGGQVAGLFKRMGQSQPARFVSASAQNAGRAYDQPQAPMSASTSAVPSRQPGPTSLRDTAAMELLARIGGRSSPMFETYSRQANEQARLAYEQAMNRMGSAGIGGPGVMAGQGYPREIESARAVALQDASNRMQQDALQMAMQQGQFDINEANEQNRFLAELARLGRQTDLEQKYRYDVLAENAKQRDIERQREDENYWWDVLKSLGGAYISKHG